MIFSHFLACVNGSSKKLLCSDPLKVVSSRGCLLSSLVSTDTRFAYYLQKFDFIRNEKRGNFERVWRKKRDFDIDASFLSDCGAMAYAVMTNVSLVLWSSHDKNFKWTTTYVQEFFASDILEMS